jgi:hypothetical protein
LVLALLTGVVLAALDGNRYIDILGISLLGLLSWNLVLYALWVANWIRPRALRGAGMARLYARWMDRRAGAVLRRSRSFNAPLAAALPRFSTEWGALALALVMQRAAACGARRRSIACHEWYGRQRAASVDLSDRLDHYALYHCAAPACGSGRRPALVAARPQHGCARIGCSLCAPYASRDRRRVEKQRALAVPLSECDAKLRRMAAPMDGAGG